MMKMLAHRTVVHQEVCLVSDKRWKKKGGKEDGLLLGKRYGLTFCSEVQVEAGQGMFQRSWKTGGSFDVVS